MSDVREWLIRKDGYYYRPNCSGYTTSKFEAGRYTKAEAEREAAVEPWHMKAIHQDDVEDDPVSSRVRMDSDRIASLQEQVEKLTREKGESSREWRDAFDSMHRRAMDAEAKLREGVEPVGLLREALAALDEIDRKDRPGFGRPALGEVARRAIRSIKPRAALLSAHPTEQTDARSGVRVKALEWRHYDNGNAYARTPFLAYIANTDGTWLFRNGVETKAGDDLDAAKAAAQADYEYRILSALEPAAPEGREVTATSFMRDCATEGCDKKASVTFERGGVGSDYCHDCYMRVQALAQEGK